MRILAIETSGESCSAALLLDGELRQRLETAPRRHGELILAMMDGLLAEAGVTLRGLDAIAFGRGPGSFTGVRIAVSVAQGVAFGAGLTTVPVSTLAALAQGERRRGGRERLLAALDARMDEVYWCAYEASADGLAPVAQELVCPPGAVPLVQGSGWWGVGSGFGVYGGRLAARLGMALQGANPQASCEAWDVAVLAAATLGAGAGVPPELARPVYLRDRVTHQGGGGR